MNQEERKKAKEVLVKEFNEILQSMEDGKIDHVIGFLFTGNDVSNQIVCFIDGELSAKRLKEATERSINYFKKISDENRILLNKQALKLK